MPSRPRLRSGTPQGSGPHPLGEIPRGVATAVGKQIVHSLAVGRTDIAGDDFGEMFATAVSGDHRSSPVGIVDVVWRRCAWSAKTLKHNKPFRSNALRIISGRNSPDYSLNISDPRENIEDTGRAVLEIWNSRIDEVLTEYDDLRVVVLVRNMVAREFVLFEDEVVRYVPDNYRWETNRQNNFEGIDLATEKKRFTWQPHGSQFTIHREVPTAASRFRIVPDVPVVEFQHIVEQTGYQDDWIEFQS